MSPDHHESHGSGYGPNSWMNMSGGYSQAGPSPSMSPMPDYNSFDYNHAPMPVEPSYSMPRPPPYATATPQMPPPLIMPHNAIWPSMIATQNHHHGSYQPPILPALPVQTPISAGTGSDVTPTSAKTSASRRKLTDDERRQMCLEAEQNPTMKQTQIGAKFNVERSTVSKILRQKDKYMNPPAREEVSSPGKKSKAKLPDFEKTLTNWVKNQQRKGVSITDEELRKQARVFSFSRSDQALLSSPRWLEKFKQKNSLGKYANSDNVESSTTSYSETPLDGSPTSSDGLVSPPMSAIDEMRQRRASKARSDEYFDFDEKATYSHPPSETQEPSDLGAALSAPLMSPLSPAMLRNHGLADMSMEDETFNTTLRQRSQTFPHVSDFSNSRPPSSGNKTPGLPHRSMTSSLDHRPTSVDPRQMMKRHKSVPDIHDTEIVRYSSMHPPPLPRSADMSPVSNPSSPTEDENIKALHTIKKLLQQHNAADSDDYVAIGKLMEKLKLLRSPSSTPQLPGGMHPVDVLDSPRISKKRTILGIST